MQTIELHKHIYPEDHLAITAATASPQVAYAAWVALLEQTDFQDINLNTQRLTSMIYRNLKDEDSVPERERLRGSYKYAWSKNQKLLYSLAPILVELTARHINYRVIKGIAVQLVLGFLGARVVGDIDIVVSESDIDQVSEIIESHGFRCNSISTCGKHPITAPHEALNFNLGENHIDVHVAERKDPQRLLVGMLQAPAVLITHMGTEIPVPPAEWLYIHSVFHGLLASSATDAVQAIVDITVLEQLCDQRTLGRLSHLTKITGEAGRKVEIKRSAILKKIRMVPPLIRDRYRGNETTLHILRNFSGRKVPYALWLVSGQLSTIERRFAARDHIFLPVPKRLCPPDATFEPFTRNAPDYIRSNNLATETLDYRFSVRVPPNSRDLQFTLDSAYLDSVDLQVFLNGVPIGRVVAGDLSLRRFTIQRPQQFNEVSLRSPNRVCPACFDGLVDLRVQVAYR